jgi:ABC-2 type transport system ATP-binding protein
MEGISIRGLQKTYKDLTAVDKLNLDIHPGELFALLGVNGAGKTTTIRMLSCLTEPTAGDALLLGKSIVSQSGEVKKLLALSPQETAVAPNLTVKENLELMAGAHGFSREKTAEKTAQLLKTMGLRDIANKRAKTLSGGWQRRLSIAMALISEPSILFLDEPTLGLDVIARSELWEVIRGLKGQVTMILTTHYMEEAEALADRVGIMKQGHLLALGTAEEIKAQAGTDRFEDAFVKIVKEADL